MSKREHKEFLSKLAALMKEYNAEIDVTYYESGCDCCGGDYEVSFKTTHDKPTGGKCCEITELSGSYIYPYMIEHKVNE